MRGATKPAFCLATPTREVIKRRKKCSQTYARHRAIIDWNLQDEGVMQFTIVALNVSLHCFSNSRNDSSITFWHSSITDFDTVRPGMPFTDLYHASCTIESRFPSSSAQLRRGMSFGKPWDFFFSHIKILIRKNFFCVIFTKSDEATWHAFLFDSRLRSIHSDSKCLVSRFSLESYSIWRFFWTLNVFERAAKRKMWRRNFSHPELAWRGNSRNSRSKSEGRTRCKRRSSSLPECGAFYRSNSDACASLESFLVHAKMFSSHFVLCMNRFLLPTLSSISPSHC